MDADDLETIDLGGDAGADGAPAPNREDEVRRPPARLTARTIAVLGIAAVVVAAAIGVGRHFQDSSRTAGGTPASTAGPEPAAAPEVAGPTFLAPPGLIGLAPGRFVAVVHGTPILVGESTPRHILENGPALVGLSQRGAVLLAYRDTSRVIVGPDFDSGVSDPLPSPINLMPDAEGRWWSNFGPLNEAADLQIIAVPPGTRPVAHLADGYLLVDTARTKLLLWHPGVPMTTVGIGRARVLAVSRRKVAWSDETGSVVHVVDLADGRTVDIALGSVAVSARFSPDRSRLAILTLTDHQVIAVADTASGKVITSLPTAHPGGGLDIGAALPPALEPVPFSWSRGGTLLLVVSTSPRLPYVTNLDPRDGSLSPPRPAPDGLEQLIPLES